MRRFATYTLAILVFATALAIHFYPELKRSLGPSVPAPVSAPGNSAAVEGPYFSDDGRVAERIIVAINRTRQTLDVAMYDLTEPNIAGAIDAAHRRGVQVRIVADEHQSRESYSEIPYLASRGVRVRLSGGYKGNRSLMHDKFAVFDHKLAVTGSFNWTTSADGYNFENAIFISEPAVAARYESEFERIWEQAAERATTDRGR